MKTTIYHIFAISCLLVSPVSLFGAISGTPSFKPKLACSDSLRNEVNIKLVYDKHMVTPLVEVFINDVKTDAIFDTGSFGLRILGGALKNDLPANTTDRINYSYGDDKRSFGIRGAVKPANIRVGNLRSTTPINIMRIDSCRYGKEAAWVATGDSATIQSRHFRDVSVIMGVGLRAAKTSKGVANPLAQLPGNGKYIVKFPHFGGAKGKLILNPDTTDLKGFILLKLESNKIMLPNGDNSWRDNNLMGALTVDGLTAWLPTMLDTGSPDVHVRSKKFSGYKAFPAGSKVIFAIKDNAGLNEPQETTINVSNHREHGKDYIYLDETNGDGKNIFGTPFFFNFDVLYDQVNGIIGIRKKN